MSILVDANTRVIVHGITGQAGAFHTRQCLDYGTKIVGGVTPGKGGTKSEHGLPVFDTAAEAVKTTGADCSLVFVPPAFAADSTLEAAAAGVKLVVLITEGIPTLDMVKVKKFLDDAGCRLVGPNCHVQVLDYDLRVRGHGSNPPNGGRNEAMECWRNGVVV